MRLRNMFPKTLSAWPTFYDRFIGYAIAEGGFNPSVGTRHNLIIHMNPCRLLWRPNPSGINYDEYLVVSLLFSVSCLIFLSILIRRSSRWLSRRVAAH